MSWIDRLLPRIHKTESEKAEKKESMIPEGLWTKCPSCEQVLYTEELKDSLMVCPKCGHHMRIGARERVENFLDAQDQVEITQEVQPTDPLKFVDSKPYPARLAQAQQKPVKPMLWLSSAVRFAVCPWWLLPLNSISWVVLWALLLEKDSCEV